MAMKNQEQSQNNNWPPRPVVFAELLTPIEAPQYLRLDETGNHTPHKLPFALLITGAIKDNSKPPNMPVVCGIARLNWIVF